MHDESKKPVGAIVAMTRDRVIGFNNTIPWHYSEDFKRFKKTTLGGVVIMGRRTWESIGSKPLPERRNIVISRRALDQVEHYHSISDALAACRNSQQAIWFIGGGQIYADAMALCTHLDITTVPDIIDPAGAILFPEIDPDTWLAGSIHPLEKDPRLSIQKFTRK